MVVVKAPINAESAVKIVSFYEMAPDALSKVTTYYPAHRARLDEFHARRDILAAGPLGNPPEGAMAVFTTREAQPVIGRKIFKPCRF
jgi:uncharacterized protein YciI